MYNKISIKTYLYDIYLDQDHHRVQLYEPFNT